MSPWRRTVARSYRPAGVLALLMVLLAAAGPLTASGRPDSVHTRAPLSRPTSWDVPGEPYPLPKRAAADWVERAGSWAAGAATPPPAELWAAAESARIAVLGVQLTDDWPQEPSVIVTARQTLAGPLGVAERDLAVRVELTQDDVGTWVVLPSRTTASAAATPAGPADTPAVRRVLGHDRIVLSGPARSDVAAGRVDDRLLDLLAALACHQEIEVSLFAGGYGTSRSDHAEDDPDTQHAAGRAADIRRIDGKPVTSEHVEGAYAVMRAARARGALAAGPLVLDGRPTPLLGDHVHLGVR